MAKALKSRASKQRYTSPLQLPLPGFETPFSQKLSATNRWVVLAAKVPWDSLVSVYQKQMRNSVTGADGINARVVLGAVIIKHMCGFSDRETVLQIQENMYMQYFIGYSSFSTEEPFDPSLFVEFRKRLDADTVNLINEKILGLSEGGAIGREPPPGEGEEEKGGDKTNTGAAASPVPLVDAKGDSGEKPDRPANTHCGPAGPQPHKGRLIIDATACPQDIRYPTDLDLLNDAREKSEGLIDLLYRPDIHKKKPRTYREVARKTYLKTAQKKQRSRKEIRRAIKRQLQYLKRNIGHINELIKDLDKIPLDRHQYKYLLVIHALRPAEEDVHGKDPHCQA